MAGEKMKLPIFHGNGIEDPQQYWFLCEAIWTARQTIDDDVKKRQLETTLRGCALEWLMRFMWVPQGGTMKRLDEIRMGLFKEFKKLKSKAQYITELKEIKQFPNETIWDFDQRFKTLMARVSFQMSDVQQKEWFIAMLVPHIRQPLMQQKIVTQSEALETAMKLEASLVGEIDVGMNQIQAQLANLTLQLQDIKKAKEDRDDIWCTRCHASGHTKDTCLTFHNYLLLGSPRPFSGVSAPWCCICQVYGY